MATKEFPACAVLSGAQAKCERCGVFFDIERLDAKPSLTRQMKRVRRQNGALHMLHYASDHGYDFDRLECSDCYGPGYAEV